MREIDNLTGIAQSLKRIDKNLGRIADALEKKKPRTVNVQGCKEATEQGRKKLAETIRDILLSQVKNQCSAHHSEQQPCPTEHRPDSDG